MKKKGGCVGNTPFYMSYAVIGHPLIDAGFPLFPHPCCFLLCRSQDSFGPKEE